MKNLVFLAVTLASFATVRAAEVNGSAGVDFTNAYYFRGLEQENQGFIAQPHISVDLPFIENIPITVGVWNSFHDAGTGHSGSGPESLYESRLTAGVGIPLGNGLTATPAYVAYTSPNGAFDTVQEVTFHVEHDSFLNPHLLLAVEVDGSRSGPDEGIYLEAGIRPCAKLGDKGVCLAFPVSVGLGLHDYYQSSSVVSVASDRGLDGDYEPPSPEPSRSTSATESSSLGVVDVGCELEAPIGAWTGKVGVHHLFLFEDARALNGGDGSEWVFGAGVSVGF